MSKRVDRKVQSKVKKLEVNLLCISPGVGKLVMEWHQITMIPKIKKVSTI
jgi:hypothetical protein